MMAEEARVHTNTHSILKPVNIQGLPTVLEYYDKWRISKEDAHMDEIRDHLVKTD